MPPKTTALVVAITGGARGIGLAIARRLCADGAQVAIGDRDAAAARQAATECGAAGFPLDVTDTESFRTFLSQVREHFGPVDVLINNAGVMRVGGFDSEPEAAIDQQFAVNVRGVMTGVRLAAPLMRQRGSGHIITIASAASLVSPPGQASYAATKHAVAGYLRAVRAELRGSGVRLSTIMPGVVDTELAAGTATGAVRLLRPDDVAAVVARVIRRPASEVTIPRRIGWLVRWANLLPTGILEFVQRRTLPNQLGTDPAVRAAYESRMSGPASR